MYEWGRGGCVVVWDSLVPCFTETCHVLSVSVKGREGHLFLCSVCVRGRGCFVMQELVAPALLHSTCRLFVFAERRDCVCLSLFLSFFLSLSLSVSV